METSGRIWCSLPANMKRIQAKKAERMWWHRFPHYKSMVFFFIRSRAANSIVCGPIRPNFELIQALMHVIVTCKYEKDPIKSIRENMMTSFFPLQLYGSYLLPWKPEFWSDLDQNLLKPFPHPNDASDKISFQSAYRLQRYSCLKVLTPARLHGRTHTQTPARLVYYKLTLWAFGSGELKKH